MVKGSFHHKEVDSLKFDCAKLSAQLSSEQKKSAKYLNDVTILSERATKSNEVATKEKCRHITTKKRMTEDAIIIKFLKSQLQDADSRIEEIKRQAMDNYKNS